MSIENITFSSGFITLERDGGRETKYPIDAVLRALDIPDLTIDSLTLLTNLAQVVTILVQTLLDKDILSEEMAGDFDWQYMREVLVDDLEAEEVY